MTQPLENINVRSDNAVVDQATLDMQDGWPQVDPELWDEQGAQISGMSVGKLRNVADKGATITHLNGEETVFPATVQTQIVLAVKDGALFTDGYDLKTHREAMDIPEMETTPAELEDQLFADSGTREESEGQELSNTRKEGTARIKWPANYHPPVRHR